MSDHLNTQMHNPASRRNRANEKSGLFRRWILKTIRSWKRRRMITALEQLDDRTLADIGVRRNDIPRVVDGFDARELRMVPLARPTTAEEAENHTLRKAA